MQMEWPNAGDNCYEVPSAFCQQLEMQMEAANPLDVEQAFRVCAFRSRSVPVPFPFRSRSVPRSVFGPAFPDRWHFQGVDTFNVLKILPGIMLYFMDIGE